MTHGNFDGTTKNCIKHRAKETKNLYDNAEATVRSLKSLWIDTNGYSTLLTPVIMSKILLEQWLSMSRIMTEEWSLDALLIELGKRIIIVLL